MAETNTDKSKEEEFYYLLTEGSEHLQAGRVDEARAHFERALLINANNEQALNLLGLSLFRLGHLERAKQIFNDLVHANPIEPSLRLNLAMVFLKQAKLEDAHTELERVLELNPDHPRAASYMGLVLEKKGQMDRAADFYERAGNKKRADEIRAFNPSKTGTFPIPNLAAMGVSQAPQTAAPGPAAMRAASTTTTTPAAAVVPPGMANPGTKTLMMGAVNIIPLPSANATQPPTAAPPPKPTAPPAATPQPTSTSSQKQSEAAALTAAAAATLQRGPEPPAKAQADNARAASMGFTVEVADKKPAETAPPAAAAKPALVVEKVAEKPQSAVLETALADLPAKAIDGRTLGRTPDGHLILPIVDVGYVRTDLLAGLSGAFEVEVVNRRYRGKRTDSLFGGSDAAVVALMGNGFALLALGEQVPTALVLTNEEIYLVESGVVGFSAGLVWENGRLPSEADKDLDIVHLRGSGRVVLGTRKPVVALPVRADAPALVHAGRLVGWSGQLVPYRAPLPGLPDSARRVPIVRFEGTGLVLAT
ncbi:MAG: tetratricopeptide repeat protein [Deltaproteobacteria bacterium]|nr:tetratricopeptide repeat protein [Deltaproteobacteria bacterium]